MSPSVATRLARGLDSRTENLLEVSTFEVEPSGEDGHALLDVEGTKNPSSGIASDLMCDKST